MSRRLLVAIDLASEIVSGTGSSRPIRIQRRLRSTKPCRRRCLHFHSGPCIEISNCSSPGVRSTSFPARGAQRAMTGMYCPTIISTASDVAASSMSTCPYRGGSRDVLPTITGFGRLAFGFHSSDTAPIVRRVCGTMTRMSSINERLSKINQDRIRSNQKKEEQTWVT